MVSIGDVGCRVDARRWGLHLMLELPRHADEAHVVRAAAAEEIRVYGAGDYYLDSARTAPALLLGCGKLPERDTKPSAKSLAKILTAADIHAS